jgi:hypothetical protein
VSRVEHESHLDFARRLWIYQAERLPVVRTATLLALFTAASLNVSAGLAGATRPTMGAYVAAFVCSFVFFAHLRICDEFKDADDDARYRPERPVPRGLLTLQSLAAVGIALVPVAVIAAATRQAGLVWLLVLVWAWMGLMTVEFFAPEWLTARPILYLLSHMMIMPLIDLLVTAFEWLARGAGPPSGLWLFLVLSFVNGCVLEIGRKIYVPASERLGVETYSQLWGIPTAIMVWCGCLAISAVLLGLVGLRLDAFWPVGCIAAVALVGAVAIAVRFLRTPSASAQKHLDLVAGLWVAVCYATAGFIPVLWSARG